ncbi:hypothetical protein HNR46_000007 [Haloferula luteola]|uniref:Uncharacterized protein n=1 Tax=Haloferula luteola TaxID=595692 RepID=A0A840UY88_9BACT|nr:hypothetical protein [Haloferula luteola]
MITGDHGGEPVFNGCGCPSLGWCWCSSFFSVGLGGIARFTSRFSSFVASLQDPLIGHPTELSFPAWAESGWESKKAAVRARWLMLFDGKMRGHTLTGQCVKICVTPHLPTWKSRFRACLVDQFSSVAGSFCGGAGRSGDGRIKADPRFLRVERERSWGALGSLNLCRSR